MAEAAGAAIADGEALQLTSTEAIRTDRVHPHPRPPAIVMSRGAARTEVATREDARSPGPKRARGFDPAGRESRAVPRRAGLLQ